MVKILVEHDDVKRVHCDALLLKHAAGFYGADKDISEAIGFRESVEINTFRVFQSDVISARYIVYLGVGELNKFRYEQIRNFASRSLKILMKVDKNIKTIASPMHGAGYGLDEQEAFLSLIAGFVDAISENTMPESLECIIIAERDKSRAGRLKALLQERLPQKKGWTIWPDQSHHIKFEEDNRSRKGASTEVFSSYGQKSEDKPKLFVAMPFADDFHDEWELAIQEAGNSIDILCERIDEQSYTGDVLSEIKKRITTANGLLALLNGSNPNVFLEIGYAWAREKPTILIIKQGDQLPFDVRGQKCIIYKNVSDLKKKLSDELRKLKETGVLEAGSKG